MVNIEELHPEHFLIKINVWRKKTWKKKTESWLIKWDIKILECPNTNEEIKQFMLEKVKAAIWTKQIGKKNVHYVKEFNPT